MKKYLKVTLCIPLLLILFSCRARYSFEELMYTTANAIIFKDKSLFKTTLIDKQRYKKLNETRFSGSYKSYLNTNINIFVKGTKKVIKKRFYIDKIVKGEPTTKFGIKLIENTRVFLRDKNNGKYHFRILYIIKLERDNYKIFMLNSL